MIDIEKTGNQLAGNRTRPQEAAGRNGIGHHSGAGPRCALRLTSQAVGAILGLEHRRAARRMAQSYPQGDPGAVAADAWQATARDVALETWTTAAKAATTGAMKMEKMISGIRARTCDAAIRYRMGAGFAGDLNRTHPAAIEPVKLDADNPPEKYGTAVILDATSHRARHLIAGDATSAGDTIDIFGCICRPWPQQQETSNEQNAAVGFGEIEAPRGVASAVRSGMIMIQLNAGVAAPVKGGQIFIWCAATSGDHVQGGFETEASAGNTAALDPTRYTYNGAPDANGITELSVNI